MKNHLLTFILYFSVCLLGTAQTKNDSILYANESDSLKQLILKQDVLFKQLLEELSTSNTKNEILKTSLETNSSVINTLSTFFTIVGVVSSLLLLIPVGNYIWMVKPLQRKIKNIDKEVTEKIDSHIASLEKNRFKVFINSLNTPNQSPDEIQFFLNSNFCEYDDENIEKIIQFLEQEDGDYTLIFSLHKLLQRKYSPITKDYYRRVIEKEPTLRERSFSPQQTTRYALHYILEHAFEENQMFFQTIITISKDKHGVLLNIVEELYEVFFKGNTQRASIGQKKIELILNNKEICDIAYNSSFDGLSNTLTYSLAFDSFLHETEYFKRNPELVESVRKNP